MSVTPVNGRAFCVSESETDMYDVRCLPIMHATTLSPPRPDHGAVRDIDQRWRYGRSYTDLAVRTASFSAEPADARETGARWRDAGEVGERLSLRQGAEPV